MYLPVYIHSQKKKLFKIIINTILMSTNIGRTSKLYCKSGIGAKQN